MDLIAFGLNFKTSTIQEREAWLVSPGRAPKFLKKFTQEKGVGGVVYVATCNRVEVYAAVEPGFDAQKYSPAYIYKNEAAFSHLLKVMCGLDSLVLGETEVFGQVKQAYSQALELKVTGPLLNFLFQRAFRIAKKIRSETGLSKHPVSVSSVAMMLLENIFGEWHPLKCLVVGLGEMGLQVVKLLSERGVEKLYLANRTESLSHDLANRFGPVAEAVAWEGLKAILPKADVVVTCTSAPSWILSKEKFVKREGFQVLIDLGVPRDIDPAIGKLDNVYLYNVDDLKTIAEKNLAHREAEASLAEGMIQKELIYLKPEWSKKFDFVFESLPS